MTSGNTITRIFERSKDNSASVIIFYCIFIASFIALLGFYLFVFSRLAFSSPNHRITESPNQQPVTIIICAKNELKNLQQYLPSVLAQEYPDFEVIVVNDASTDGSRQWLTDFAKQHPKLRVVENTETTLPGKRNALKKGLEAAKNQTILLTDADCQPASNQWIRLMTSSIQPETQIVLGFSPCFEQPGWLNRFIRYENFLTALYYLSFSLAKMPYMGVGRNLLYRTPVQTTIGALVHHSSLISGDDDLTVNRIATNPNTALMLHPKSHVFTPSAQTIRALIHQKRRHYATGLHYQPQHKIVLGTLYASQALFNITALALIVSGFMLIPTLAIFIIKNILQTFLFGKAMSRLNVHNLWICTPVFDLCFTLFFLTLGGLSLTKNKSWK